MQFLPLLLSVLAFLPLSEPVRHLCWDGTPEDDLSQVFCSLTGNEYCANASVSMPAAASEFHCGRNYNCTKEGCDNKWTNSTGTFTVCCCKGEELCNGNSLMTTTTVIRTTPEATTYNTKPASIPSLLLSLAAIAAMITALTYS